ncbi:hypothetical protein J3R82DRAFT_6423 [Butyriboletus roseoflavus]|nr:hypothetical protein J3R82DRAFT_6423 [Butyriboletus roseoflavus]
MELRCSHPILVGSISCLTRIGDLLYLWRYDRQRPIQYSALDFIRDLPRFLVLLLTMQRFENRHQGLSRHIDPDFGELSTASTTVLIEDPKDGPFDIVLDCSPGKRLFYYGLNGRATNMFPLTSQKFGSRRLVSKFFWDEESRVGEPGILKRVYEIAEREPVVRNHVLVVFSHVYLDSSTAIIRERLGLPTRKEGALVLNVIVFEELMQIRKVAGDLFLECWWRTVEWFVFPSRIKLALKLISHCGRMVFTTVTSLPPI